MSSVLTSKLPGINPAFLSSHLLNAGNRNVVMYQHEPVGSPGFGVGIGSGGSGSPLGVDPVRAAVAHLFSKAYSLPCSTAAHSFANLVQPTSRFQLALDALLPILEQNTSTDVRIVLDFEAAGVGADEFVVIDIAGTTYLGLLHSLLSLRTPSDNDQPIQIRLVLDIC